MICTTVDVFGDESSLETPAALLSRLSIYHLFHLGTESRNLTFFVPEESSSVTLLFSCINT